MADSTDDAHPTGWRHWLGFVGSGTLAFVVDAAVLKGLTVLAHWSPLEARVVSIAVATVAGWLSHRTFTFRVTARPTLAEFGKYLGVAGSASLVNYAVFAAVLLIRPQTETLVALVGAGLVAMVASYLGMRFGAFKRPGA